MRAPRWLRIPSAILLAAICLQPGSVAAQTLEPPRQRQGYWLQVGLHGLMAETWEKGEHLGTWRGNILTLRLGQLLTSRFGLGILYSSGAASGTAWGGIQHLETFTGLAMEAQWNPWRNLGLHGAAGMQFVALRATEGPDKGTRGNWGTGYALGISYDFFPLSKKRSGGFCLTPMLLAQYSPGATVATATFLAGLQVGYWTGLGGNQLDLRGDEAYQEK
jgi:hypothetical protein